ncbi:MAG: hypothetical protein MJ221_00025 [Bacilli bacterium]|nr:hypothetical protein [Bacilli bacterium]
MKKFLSPILNIISMILVGIAYGLGGITAAHNVAQHSIGNYYQIVWGGNSLIALNVVGFFLIVAGSAFLLLVFIPKCRKYTAFLTAGLLIAGGVLALMSPANLNSTLPVYNQPGLIGMASLLFAAGFFSLLISVIEFASKE